MSPDGKEIVLLTQNGRIVRVDAVTLSVLSATNPLGGSQWYLQSAAVLNDGNVLVAAGTSNSSSLYLFNLITQTFTPVANSGINLDISLMYVSTSGDGSHSLSSGINSIYSYDAGTGSLSTISNSYSRRTTN